MKLVLFNVREDEKSAVDSWIKAHPEVEVATYQEELNAANKHLLDGADGAVFAANKPFDKEIYPYAKAQGVKVFSTRSAGFDVFDRPLLKELGIKLTNVPSYSPNAIAEHVLTTALRISRNTIKIQRNVEKHNFTWNPGILSRELRTLTVGVIGTGRIGTQAARLFKAVGSEVIGYDVYPNDVARGILTYVDNVDELIEKSDIITIHMPAVEQYKHMVSDEFLAKMKDGAILLNAARGMLVDTKALLKALDSGKLLGAGLDVYENESKYVPKNFEDKDFDDELLQTLIDRDDVIYTPHTAFYTETAIQNLVDGGLNSAIDVIKTGTSVNIIE
ncbi:MULTISPECIES: D-2-hydroxyacid dehydrogenase [Gemella]|uniref:D-2-hydroxyacid dehydrogenase n=1 Tax=Gemella TaxID=1378 RepID=UPI000767EFF9|nr:MULTISPECIES: D-2-hydroxyacid dehydrogenase [Gemella]AME10076.1 lactate dehydrogenase [Gemella sp. oral taxon 928]AXI26211.1 lactate dehydrogenase [Gemella sp. ND 6198]